jgi:hypothetical protein
MQERHENWKTAFNTVTYVPIARQRLGKHIPAGANAQQ